MRYDFILAAVLFGLGSLSLIGAIYTFSRKELVLGIRLIGAIALAGMFQLFGYASLLLTDTESYLLIYSRIQYLGIAFFYALWYILSYQQRRRIGKIPFRDYWPYLVLPVIVFVAMLHYPWRDGIALGWLNRLFFQQHEVVGYAEFGSGFFGIVFTKGALFYVSSIYNALMMLGAGANFVIMRRNSKKSIRHKSVIMTIISFVLALVPLVSLIGSETLVLDLSPALLFIGLASSFAILYGNDFLNLIPSAQTQSFLNSDMPAMIIDKSQLVINVNFKAREIFAEELDFNEITLLEDFDRIHPGFSRELLMKGQTEVTKMIDGSRTFYYVRLVSLKRAKNRLIGYLMYFSDITEHKLEMQEMELIATYDDLTKILNRRAFYLRASAAFEEATIRDESFSLIMFDLDGFKEVNDVYGHQVGDAVLNEVARVVHEKLEDRDIFARYGGEEFIIFTRNKCPGEGCELAEAIRSGLEKYRFVHNDKEIRITASFGVSGTNGRPDKTLKQYIRESDEGLYKAKGEGKNKVVVV